MESSQQVTVKINGLMKFVLLVVAVSCFVSTAFVYYTGAQIEAKVDCYNRRSKKAMMLVHGGTWNSQDLLDLVGMCDQSEDHNGD